MSYMTKTYKRGFTLIELLVVIAIIGILSSIVLASLNSARKKGRDARRISDIKQIQLALELAFDADGVYPSVLATTTLVTPGYIAAVPADPTNGEIYAYTPTAIVGSETLCTAYHLGASLETSGHAALDSDSDIDALADITDGALCTDPDVIATGVLNGDDAAKCQAADAGGYCFDVRP